MDISKLTLRYVWRGKRHRIINTVLEENKIGGLTLPNFKKVLQSYNNRDYVGLVRE